MIGNKWRKGYKPANGFKPKHKPWNKGLKGLHLSPESEFKNGHQLTERFPLGTITIRKDEQGNRRRWIKMETGWIEFATVLWSLSNGPVPKSHVIHHVDRDSLHDELSNYQCLTRAQHLDEHRYEIRGVRRR